MLKQGRWISLVEECWQTEDGSERSWEYVTREGGLGAVCVMAIKRGDPDRLILVKQFRPPLNAETLELPAGLIECGETEQTTALKELREETGYVGQIVNIGPPLYNSPGLTDEQVTPVMIEVTEKGNQDLQEDELIEVVELPVPGLRDQLCAQQQQGVRIDAKLWSLAEGLHFLSATDQ